MSIIAKNNDSLRFQKVIVLVGILLLVIKFLAWYTTNSVAILTDALESIVNVISGLVGLYSLYLSALPKDKNHPYGHGKVEFISAFIEGGLIAVAGIIIIYEAIGSLRNHVAITQLDYGIYLVAFAGLVNYILGYIAVKKGKKNHSLALVASGKHLQTDTYTTVGLVLGLIVIQITQIFWLDAVVAFVFAGLIIYTGYKIIREAISGIMDETDEKLMDEVVDLLNKNRQQNWIDLHNLRIIKYGSTLHFDCHMTVPWYFNIQEGHEEVDKLEDLVKNYFGNRVEFFVHLDACKSYSCLICSKTDCPVRQQAFVQQITWTTDNVCKNQKHLVDE